jgi:hypothetical protein
MFAMRMMMRRLMVVMSRCMVVRCGEMVMLLRRMVSHLYLLTYLNQFIGNVCGLIALCPALSPSTHTMSIP